jgi:3-oxoadipate enol-lactonase
MKANIRGIEIYYVIDGDGPWLTLSHSLSANLGMWQPQVDALKASYRILRFDTRGHGRSAGPPAPYTMPELAYDLNGLLDHLGIARTHLCGLSLGGALSTTFALAYPDMVDRLIIADATAAYKPETHPMWRQRAEAVETGGMEAIADGTLSRWFTDGFRQKNPEFIAGIRAMILGTSTNGLIGCAHAIMGFDVLGRLHEISKPTLVIAGAEDQALPVAQSRAIADGIKGAGLIVIPDAAHISNLEQPAAFTKAMREFLGQRQ